VFDCFSELSEGWKSIAAELGCQYSAEPPTVEGVSAEDCDFWRPPVLTAKHRNWTIRFSSNPFIPRVGFVAPIYTVFVESPFAAIRQFDVVLQSTETVAHLVGVLSSPFEHLLPQKRNNAELMQKLFPVDLHKTRTNVSEIDRHYSVESFNLEDPQTIFSDLAVKEALLKTPKVGLRAYGFPGMDTDCPNGLDCSQIGSMEFLHPNDKERIGSIIRLYGAVLDRLLAAGYISAGSMPD
jgi:hypothetical protein